MIAELGRYLNQRFDEMMELEDVMFFQLHQQISEILEDENPKK